MHFAPKKQVVFEIGPSRDAHVFFFQKRLTDELVRIAANAKRRGRLVVYDVDDVGNALSFWAPRPLFNEMLTIADCVTTSGSGFAEYLQNEYGVTTLEIYPDSIDYFPSGLTRPPMRDTRQLTVLWFGNPGNLTLLQPYIKQLTSLPWVRLVVCTSPAGCPSIEPDRNIHIVPWHLARFTSVLQSCHLTCLMHDGERADRVKSCNRMITSVGWGVPAIVSRTPEYERVAKFAGVEYALFSSPSDLPALLGLFADVRVRKLYLDTAQAAVWARHAPATVARLFLDIIQSRLDART
jgi:hypothetical protein